MSELEFSKNLHFNLFCFMGLIAPHLRCSNIKFRHCSFLICGVTMGTYTSCCDDEVYGMRYNLIQSCGINCAMFDQSTLSDLILPRLLQRVSFMKHFNGRMPYVKVTT